MNRQPAFWTVAIASFFALAAVACSDEDEPPKQEPGSLSALASTVNEASQALVDSVLDKEVSNRWKFPKAARKDLDVIGRQLERLGAVDRLFSVMELEAVRRDGNPRHLNATVAVFPDGTVAWAAIGAQGGKAPGSSTGIEAAGPGLASGVRAMVEIIASDQCESLRIVQRDDFASFPAAARKLYRDPSNQLPRVCRLMQGQTEGWTPRVDSLTVVLSDGEQVGVLRSGLDVSGIRLALRVPSFKAM